MKSRTSSCKRAAFRKDLSRFWPVWVGYILWLAIMQVIISNDDLSYWYAANLGECITVMGVVNLIYGLIAAQMLFGDLFNTRMCNGLHSLPLRREHWFSVHIQAGFLFSLIPTALMTGFSELVIYRFSDMVDGWQIPLYWFAGSNLQFVFFFGLAVFCCMCAGSRFGATVVYGILNFFSLLIYLLVDQLYTPLLHGVVTMSTLFERLCPVYNILSNRSIDAERVETGKTYIDSFGIEQQEYIGKFELTPDGWIYAGILAVLGLVLLLLARRIYKKRNLERAGDFLSARWLEPVFQVVFTVLCAAGFHAVFILFFGLNTAYRYVLPAIGLTVGWFAGRMFLERTTRVFRFKNFAGFALIAALMAGSLYVTALDPLGIETWIPETGEIQSATLRMNYRSGITTEDPEEMEDFLRLHELALEQRVEVHPDYDDNYFNPYSRDPDAVQITLQYTTGNGWLSQRNYHILATGESGALIREYCSRLDSVISRNDVQTEADLHQSMKIVTEVSVSGYPISEELLTEEFLTSLADAIIADCDAGNLVQSGVFHPQPMIEMEDPLHSMYQMELNLHGMNFWTGFIFYADCENILKVLEPTGVLDRVRSEYEAVYTK